MIAASGTAGDQRDRRGTSGHRPAGSRRPRQRAPQPVLAGEAALATRAAIREPSGAGPGGASPALLHCFHVHDPAGDAACRAATIAEARRAIRAGEAFLAALELGADQLAPEFGEALRVVERLARRTEGLEELARGA